MSFAHRLADRMQRAAARSPLLVRAAIALRNQARCVIKYHLAESPDTLQTGEVWLQDAVVPHASRFVDVGANVGDWIAGIAARKGDAPFEAIAFEPSSSAFQRLKERLHGDRRIEFVEAAAAESAGEATFLEEPDAGRGSTLVPGLGRLEGSSRTVAITTIDDELKRRGWSGADVVKVDAEGFDARVIRGAREALDRGAIGVLQFEYNRSWQLAGETLYGVMSFLEARNYRTYVLKRDGLFRLDYARYEEYFEYSNYVALDPGWNARLAAHFRGTI